MVACVVAARLAGLQRTLAHADALPVPLLRQVSKFLLFRVLFVVFFVSVFGRRLALVWEKVSMIVDTF